MVPSFVNIKSPPEDSASCLLSFRQILVATIIFGFLALDLETDPVVVDLNEHSDIFRSNSVNF